MERRQASIVMLCCALVFVVAAGQASAQVSCSGVPAFASCTAYASGASVTYSGSKYHSIVGIPADRDCPPNHPFNPANDNWWVNDGTCTAGATATATRAATATATATTGATATRTATATATPTTGGATATRTNTATATRTSTATPTATTGSGSNNLYQAAYWTQNNDPCTNNGPAGSGEEWIPQGACSGQAAWVATTAYNGGAQACRVCGGSNPTATATATTGGSTPTRTATPTTGPTPTSCGACGGGLPAKVYTGYWQNFNNGAQVQKLSNVPSKYNLIAVAFADNAGGGAISFTLDLAGTSYASVNDFKADINTLHGQGRKVIISVGGQNGSISVGDSGAATAFANSVVSLMNSYGFDGVDIDLENGISAGPMTQALKSVRSQKPGAIITTAPQTIDMLNSTSAYFQVALNTPVDIVNLQNYNSGCMLGCSDQVHCWGQGTEDFVVMLACQELQQGLSPSQVGIGLPASPSGAGGGYMAPSVANAAMNCIKSGTSCGTLHPPQTWPAGVRGAMSWSTNWDGSSGFAWINGISVP